MSPIAAIEAFATLFWTYAGLAAVEWFGGAAPMRSRTS